MKTDHNDIFFFYIIKVCRINHLPPGLAVPPGGGGGGSPEGLFLDGKYIQGSGFGVHCSKLPQFLTLYYLLTSTVRLL